MKTPIQLPRTAGIYAFVAILFWNCSFFASQAAAFTYQGRLVDAGVLANGNYELRFRLFDSLSAGTRIGADQTQPSVGVTNGVFTVALDFGGSAFDGNARWLEISARTSGSSAPFEVFTPRQPVNAVPYAMFALNSANDATIQALISQLTSSVNSLSNQLQSISVSGLSAASMDPSDTALQTSGFQLFQTIAAPSWRSGSATGIPSARVFHAGLWTGQTILIWGGFLGGSTYSSTGSLYDPAADTWTAISTVNAPAARRGPGAVWTGDAMLIWGGFNGSYLNNGASYTVSNSTWAALGTTGAPSGREGHSANWTGSRLVVFGGRNLSGLIGDGALYNRTNTQWTALPTLSAPSARSSHSANWTGSQLVVWGGLTTTGETDTGAILPISGGTTPGTWTTTTSVGAPSPRQGHVAVLAGQRIFIWGGKQGSTLLGDGALFDPINNAWSPISSANAPTPRSGASAAWTGTEVVLFGGETAAGTTSTGAAYNPTSGTWRSLVNGGAPQARSSSTALWTGTELVLFGGLASGSPIAALQRVDPKPAWYLYRKP